MATLKVDSYTDAPDSLEKGCSPRQGLHSEICHACSRHPAQTRRRSFVKHPWIILSTMALTWLVLSYGRRAFIQPRSVGQYWGSDKMGHPPPPPPPPPPHPPADGDVNQCVDSANWTFYDEPPWASDYPYGAETAFSLQLDSDVLSLISKGGFQQGIVNIEQSVDIVDTVNVHVRVAYHADDIFERTTVCQIERGDREYGVGIFSPKLPHIPTGPLNQLNFDVTLTLPAGAEGSLPVKRLETRMPNYSQNVADLHKSVLFDSISLWSANGRLNIQSVTSEVGQFSSLNGEIEGRFNALSSLDLHSLNGRITSTVNVLHREGADPPHVSIRTLNGQINAEVSLTSDTTTGGEFEVDAESKNGEVGIKFAQTPVDSVLRCRAQTTVGKVEVELDSAFEGTYSLQTFVGAKQVSQRDAEDPAGKGRHRVVSQNKGFGHVEGEVKWVENDGSSSGNEGHVVLKGVASSVRLIV